MSLQQQNSQRSRFNPYFQSANNGQPFQVPNMENANNESQRNPNKDRPTRFFENSFINKTYHHVRSFGKDLSNL